MKNATLWLLLALAVAAALAGGAVLTLPPGTQNPIVTMFANAIAFAEGFFVAGSRSQRNNNPGDVTDSFGQATTGQDGPFPIFATVQDGWDALYEQVYLMFYGGSKHYNSSMTIAQVGAIYANGDPNWANNVAANLGVTTDTTLNQLMTAGG